MLSGLVGSEMCIRDRYKLADVCVAVQTDIGLMVPVVRAACCLGLRGISSEVKSLAEKAKMGKLQGKGVSGGTFTVSNLGMFGVDRFDAILPPGTGAILAVAASRHMVVAGKDGSISVKRQMQVNLTADHRVVYGADGASFLKDLADLIENRPESLAL